MDTKIDINPEVMDIEDFFADEDWKKMTLEELNEYRNHKNKHSYDVKNECVIFSGEMEDINENLYRMEKEF